jgi:CubicO group peptidase (beta-lactamase class C family)
MAKKQFLILYRQFLFRMMDPELLSADAQGDMSKLFGQFASLLVFLGLGLAMMGFGIDAAKLRPTAQVIVAWSGEHFLIATTMLVVGLFAVLSWDSTFPDRRDIFVLGHLPVRSRTMFVAKIAAVATALSVTVAALHFGAGIVWPFALNKERPATVAPAITYEPALPPVDADKLKSVLDRDLADQLRTGVLARGRGGGVSIAVWKHGVQRVFAYGAARPDSIFEIGSITKTFTGLALARLAVDRKASLKQPLRELLPAGTVAQAVGPEITLLDLATHRSGLRPDNVHGDDVTDRMNSYNVHDMYAYISKRGLAKRGYVPMEYSNFGVALLGQAIADYSGTNYAELIEKQIAIPLGMRDTAVHLSAEQRGRLIQGYTQPGHPVEPFNLGALAPAGALRSTAADMILYLAANLHPELVAEPGLPAALTLSHKVQAPLAPGWDIALGWFHNVDLSMYAHEGVTPGYTSSAFFVPSGDYAAVVLVNSGADEFGLFRVLSEHIRARLAGEPAISLNQTIEPVSGGIGGVARLFVAYWVTMFAAGAFIFCCVLGAQGLAAQLVPRQVFLRMSSVLQLAAFALFVCVYFLEPKLVAPGELATGQSHAYLEWSPTYWFLGLFQLLNGSPALAPLAWRAWTGLATVLSATGVAYSLAYLRTTRKIVEAPDIVSGSRSGSWLPRFGGAFETAVGQFSLRTILRSRQHRLMVAFYLGIGFAASVLLPRWPVMRELAEEAGGGISLSLMGSTILFTGLCVLGTRVAFALPMDLHANWIFRFTPIPSARGCLAARRRTFYAVAVGPVWTVSAGLLFAIWPWAVAAKHVLVLVLLGAIFVELGLYGVQKLPFTCSYLPGKSYFHMAFLLGVGTVLGLIAKAVQLERGILDDSRAYAALVITLAIVALGAWWRATALSKTFEGQLQFEDAADPAVFVLDLHRDGSTVMEPRP